MKLTVIRGLPGSGKSTLAKKMQCLHVETDMYCVRNGIYEYKDEERYMAVSMMKKIVCIALSENMDIVTTGTFTKRKHIESLKRLAKAFNADFEVIKTVNYFGDIHKVPSFKIEKMKNEWEDYPNELII